MKTELVGWDKCEYNISSRAIFYFIWCLNIKWCTTLYSAVLYCTIIIMYSTILSTLLFSLYYCNCYNIMYHTLVRFTVLYHTLLYLDNAYVTSTQLSPGSTTANWISTLHHSLCSQRRISNRNNRSGYIGSRTLRIPILWYNSSLSSIEIESITLWKFSKSINLENADCITCQ